MLHFGGKEGEKDGRPRASVSHKKHLGAASFFACWENEDARRRAAKRIAGNHSVRYEEAGMDKPGRTNSQRQRAPRHRKHLSRTPSLLPFLATATRDLRDAESLAAHDDVKVHAEDTDSGVVLDAEVNVLVNAKAKVARVGEVLLVELVLLDLVGGGGAQSGR